VALERQEVKQSPIHSFGPRTALPYTALGSAIQNISSPTADAKRLPLASSHLLPSFCRARSTSLSSPSCWVLGVVALPRWGGKPRDRDRNARTATGRTAARTPAGGEPVGSAAAGTMTRRAGPTTSHHLPWPSAPGGSTSILGTSTSARAHARLAPPSLTRCDASALPTISGDEVELGYAMLLFAADARRPLSAESSPRRAGPWFCLDASYRSTTVAPAICIRGERRPFSGSRVAWYAKCMSRFHLLLECVLLTQNTVPDSFSFGLHRWSQF
jgi:hypothetical protein